MILETLRNKTEQSDAYRWSAELSTENETPRRAKRRQATRRPGMKLNKYRHAYPLDDEDRDADRRGIRYAHADTGQHTSRDANLKDAEKRVIKQTTSKRRDARSGLQT